MGVRNRRPDLNGVFHVSKPLGWSSARVVALVRRVTHGAKVGHAGTLDPLATGVLVICVGRATKAAETIQSLGKRYTAVVDLSRFTTTDDAEGDDVAIADRDPAAFGVAPLPEAARLRSDARSGCVEPPSQALIERAISARFVGDVFQRPPDFSAVHVAGVRAYRLARSGVAPEIKSKLVRIDHVCVRRYAWPRVELDVRCGKGTYIRSLARDLGLALGSGGTLTGLVRTAVGPFAVGDATPTEGLTGEHVEAALREVDTALNDDAERSPTP